MKTNVYAVGSYIKVEITERFSTKYVTIHSKIHVNGSCLLPHSYSNEFTDSMILQDSDFFKYLSRYL